jgi:hypothetical protein
MAVACILHWYEAFESNCPDFARQCGCSGFPRSSGVTGSFGCNTCDDRLFHNRRHFRKRRSTRHFWQISMGPVGNTWSLARQLDRWIVDRLDIVGRLPIGWLDGPDHWSDRDHRWNACKRFYWSSHRRSAGRASYVPSNLNRLI